MNYKLSFFFNSSWNTTDLKQQDLNIHEEKLYSHLYEIRYHRLSHVHSLHLPFSQTPTEGRALVNNAVDFSLSHHSPVFFEIRPNF